METLMGKIKRRDFMKHSVAITPHIAWASLAARKRLMAKVVENVRAYLRGAPVNVVNSV